MEKSFNYNSRILTNSYNGIIAILYSNNCKKKNCISLKLLNLLKMSFVALLFDEYRTNLP